MAISLNWKRTPNGIEYRTPTGHLVGRGVSHGFGMWEMWLEPDFKRDMPFLWSSLDALEYGMLAVAIDRIDDPVRGDLPVLV